MKAFYEAALTCLRFVEHRTPTRRRFGPDADARWASLRGHLTMADRIDTLLRDADAQFPGAFGARVAFDLRGVAEEDAFGADWKSLTPAAAEALWKRTVKADPPADRDEALERCAAALDLPLSRVTVGALTPATRLLVAGPSAIVAVARAMAKGEDLSWADQVTCIASPPSHRQLAALVAAIVNSNSPTRLVTPSATKLGRVDRVVTSKDADADDLHAALKRAS